MAISSKERVIKVLSCESTDHPPLYDLLRNDAAVEHYAGEKLTIKEGRRTTIKAMSNMLDATKQFMRFPQEERRIERDGKLIEQKRWTWWPVKQDEDNQISLIARIKDYISNYKGWDENSQNYLDGRIRDFQEKQAEAGDMVIFPTFGGMITGWISTAYEYCGGIDRFSYLLMDEPTLISHFLDVLFQQRKELIGHYTGGISSPMVFHDDDVASRNGLIFSPQFLKRELIPRLKKMVEIYHQKGFKVMFHSDGNLWEIMDDLVDCDIDALNPIETMAGMDIKKLRRCYPKLILVGGIDCSQLLPYGTPNEVREVTRKAIVDAQYGYFVGSSSELHNQIPLENILSMVEEAAKIYE